MQTIIDNAIEQINQGTDWILKNAKVDKKKSYKVLVKERRKLKKIRSTCDSKATVVLYGQSQCGKSHLSSSLLSANGKPMQVIDRMNNVKYEFLTHLNPQGSGEATGLITRFTTLQQKDITKEYPVHLKLMSVKDIALMLCDGYYRDIQQREPFSVEGIKRLLEELKLKKTAVRQDYISEDDMGDIEEYFNNFSSDLYYALSSEATDYFSELSVIIEYLSEKDVIAAVEMLWNNDPNISDKFEQLFQACKKVAFSKDVFVSFDELENSKGVTLLDVRWLDFKDLSTMSSVLYYTNANQSKEIQLEKTFLAAICSEIVLEVVSPEPLDEMDVEKKNAYIRLITQNVDILDFPGARPRGGLISTAGHEAMLIRRGKVGYYFNKYSSERKINALLFCWEPDNFNAKPMEDSIRRWIDISLGRTAAERSEYLSSMDVSPLFFVGTKFNMHLQNKTDDRADNPKALSNRWDKWFLEQLSTDIIGVPSGQNERNQNDNYKWFEDWTISNNNYDNIYLLRDFRYSSSIFEGWTEQSGHELGQRKEYEIYDGFYAKLRKSFIEHPFVKRHFRDAATRWDEASEANCDGSLPIARNLASIVGKIAAAAAAKNMRDINEAISIVIEELSRHHYDTDTEVALTKALNSAARLQSSLAIAFGRDPYYFGRFMKAVTISEYTVHEVFSDVFQKFSEAANIGDYVYIYMRAPGIKPSNTFDDNLRILRTAYGFSNEEECRNYFEGNLQINLNDLFQRSEFGLQSPSQMLAAKLKSFWFDEWLSNKQSKCLSDMLGEESFKEMVDMLDSLFVKYEVERRIAQTIHNYVDTFGIDVKKLSEMIADICAEMINKFVLSVGYDYYSKEEGVIDNLKDASSQHKIDLHFKLIETEHQEASNMHIAEMMARMDDMESIRQLLINPNEHSLDALSAAIPGFRQSRRWSDLAKIGYVLTKDIPHYDVEANNLLGGIINKCETLIKQ